MQSVNPPDNKACQTSVSNRHLRGNYPPFAALYAIISRKFWSGPVKNTALDPSQAVCLSPQCKQCRQTKESEHTLVPIFPVPASCVATWSRDFQCHRLWFFFLREIFSPKVVMAHMTFYIFFNLCYPIWKPLGPCGYLLHP